MSESMSERRRYFRVSDSVGVRYEVLGRSDDNPAASVETAPALNMLAELENKISAALEPLRKSNPQLLEVLSLFNQKINLSYHRESESHHDLTVQSQNVNLSACGIAFPIDERLPLNQGVLLDLMLYPSNISLKLEASVIGCDPIDQSGVNGGYLLRVDFLDLSEGDQEVLVQHVIRCQSQQLKLAREARTQG